MDYRSLSFASLSSPLIPGTYNEQFSGSYVKHTTSHQSVHDSRPKLNTPPTFRNATAFNPSYHLHLKPKSTAHSHQESERTTTQDQHQEAELFQESKGTSKQEPPKFTERIELPYKETEHIHITIRESTYVQLQNTHSIITSNRPVRVQLETRDRRLITWTLGGRLGLPGTRRKIGSWESEAGDYDPLALVDILVVGHGGEKLQLDEVLWKIGAGGARIRILVDMDHGKEKSLLLPPIPEKWPRKKGAFENFSDFNTSVIKSNYDLRDRNRTRYHTSYWKDNCDGKGKGYEKSSAEIARGKVISGRVEKNKLKIKRRTDNEERPVWLD